MERLLIRPVEPKDNPLLAEIIKEILTFYKANKQGTAFSDDSIYCLFQTFQIARSGYFVAERNGVVVGGGGIYPTLNLPVGYCELVKLYLKEEARGIGLGMKLIECCMAFAKNTGYTHMYLETLPELHLAIPVYEKMGFKKLERRLGDSGHYSCTIWMEKKLN